MPAVGLSEAAKLTGRNQSTIHRAMKTGRIAFAVAENGERRIDIAELERSFGLKGSARPDASAQPLQSNAVQADAMAALQRLLDDREGTIRDLRARLDASEAERRAAQAQVTALLTDQRGSRGVKNPQLRIIPYLPRRGAAGGSGGAHERRCSHDQRSCRQDHGTGGRVPPMRSVQPATAIPVARTARRYAIVRAAPYPAWLLPEDHGALGWRAVQHLLSAAAPESRMTHARDVLARKSPPGLAGGGGFVSGR